MTAHNRNEDEFDDILDHALSAYRDAEPLAGMEDRVLHRITTRSEARSRIWWRWGAVAVAAMVILVAAIALRSRLAAPMQRATQNPLAPVEVARSDQPPSVAPKSALPGKPGPSTRSKPESVSVRSSLPRLSASRDEKPGVPMPDRFPTPTPLTAEERVLLALARTRPEMLFNPPEEEREVQIPLIEIKLLPESNVQNVENEGDN